MRASFGVVKREKGGLYSSQGEKLSTRKVEDAVNSYRGRIHGADGDN